jgi:hypothetical protein
MELEITIKVPLGAAGVSVEQSTTGAEASQDGAVEWPPSPAEFGLSATPSSAELAPPPLEMIEQLAARTATTNGPPGIEDVPMDEVLAGAQEGQAEPPDLPDMSSVEPDVDEFAPPPIDDAPSPPSPVDDIEPTRSRRGSGRG